MDFLENGVDNPTLNFNREEDIPPVYSTMLKHVGFSWIKCQLCGGLESVAVLGLLSRFHGRFHGRLQHQNTLFLMSFDRYEWRIDSCEI